MLTEVQMAIEEMKKLVKSDNEAQGNGGCEIIMKMRDIVKKIEDAYNREHNPVAEDVKEAADESTAG